MRLDLTSVQLDQALHQRQSDSEPSLGAAESALRLAEQVEPARVKVVVASVMQPTVEYRDCPNTSL